MPLYTNGGLIGGMAPSGTTAGSGVWGVMDVYNRQLRINTDGNTFTWPQAPDPSFSSVVGLYHFNTYINDTSTLPDTSTSPTLLNASSPGRLNPFFKKFGVSSFDDQGNYAATTAGNLSAYNFGTGDFTMEGWFYPLLVGSGYQCCFQTGPGVTTFPVIYSSFNGVNAIHYYSNSAVRITGSTALSTSTWYHIALSRVSGTSRLFLNGTQEGSSYTDSTNFPNGQLSIGNILPSPTQGFSGYFDEVRITKGVGRYSANFTAPTAPFPDY